MESNDQYHDLFQALQIDPRVAFILEGIPESKEDLIGDFGLVNGAASGDEIHRMDFEIGTPRSAILIASSKRAGSHSDAYCLFSEELKFPMINTVGTISDKIRSDMIYYETRAGGAVFSVGSINGVRAPERWAISRSHADICNEHTGWSYGMEELREQCCNDDSECLARVCETNSTCGKWSSFVKTLIALAVGTTLHPSKRFRDLISFSSSFPPSLFYAAESWPHA